MARNNPLDQLTDEELLTRFCQGQSDTFGALVRRYERELYGYLRRYLGDAGMAEDVFQNTFLQLYIKSNQYEAGRPVRPWLYTIATNQAIDALRRNNRHQAVSLDQKRVDHSDDDVQSLMDALESHGTSPINAAEESERREMVRNSVNRLPDFLRHVLILAYYQGLKHKEIAEIMEIPVGTVKSRLHAALGKLHEMWSETPSLHEI